MIKNVESKKSESVTLGMFLSYVYVWMCGCMDCQCFGILSRWKQLGGQSFAVQIWRSTNSSSIDCDRRRRRCAKKAPRQRERDRMEACSSHKGCCLMINANASICFFSSDSDDATI